MIRTPSPLAPLPQPGEGNNSVSNGARSSRANRYRDSSNQNPFPGSRRGAGERSLLTFAKRLRTEQTDAELKLWYHLRAGRFMNLKFKRQKPVGPYIADFICTEHKLIIECDGGQHGDVSDQCRDAWLVTNGYTVLRFWNHHVLHETESVLERIRQTILASQTANK
jgi:very-short-patch-repair endonuclease